jgi:hypothetical protein
MRHEYGKWVVDAAKQVAGGGASTSIVLKLAKRPACAWDSVKLNQVG